VGATVEVDVVVADVVVVVAVVAVVVVMKRERRSRARVRVMANKGKDDRTPRHPRHSLNQLVLVLVLRPALPSHASSLFFSCSTASSTRSLSIPPQRFIHP